MKLDFSAWIKAMASLEEALKAATDNPANRFIRDASIQRFEYTWELSHKMLRRYLEITEPNAEQVDQMSFPELIRTASERGLLQQGWDTWKIYRDARNITSHTYDEKKAAQVFAVIPAFFIEATYLLDKLRQRSHS